MEISNMSESGWTMYLQNSSSSCILFEKYVGNPSTISQKEEEEEEEDPSMASDASSGPHHHQDTVKLEAEAINVNLNLHGNPKRPRLESYDPDFLEDTASSKADADVNGRLEMLQSLLPNASKICWEELETLEVVIEYISVLEKTIGAFQSVEGSEVNGEQGKGWNLKKRGLCLRPACHLQF